MRNPLRRFYGRGDLHFLTFSCYRRLPLLGTERARDRFVKILDEVRNAHQFQLLGYVVMPEHVHLLISEPPGRDPSRSLQVLKQRVSRALRKRSRRKSGQQLTLPFGGEASLPVFWQRRFYDFNVWSEKKFREKLDYMHRNPLERKLVTHPQDWPWSSWHHYARGSSLIRIDSLKEARQRPGVEKSKPAPFAKPAKSAGPHFKSLP